MTEASSFLMAMPELVLTVAGLILLMVAAYAGDRATHAVSWLSVLALGAAGITLLLPTTHGTAFDGLYQADAFAAFATLLIYIAAAIPILIAPRWEEQTPELHYLSRTSYAASALKKKITKIEPDSAIKTIKSTL